MLFPLLNILTCPPPVLMCYHSISTGYGVFCNFGQFDLHKPLFLTEHGIYTREREEELLVPRGFTHNAQTVGKVLLYVV
ncbi:MAG: DUF3492 domain-containing protein [Streptococcus salivarius]